MPIPAEKSGTRSETLQSFTIANPNVAMCVPRSMPCHIHLYSGARMSQSLWMCPNMRRKCDKDFSYFTRPVRGNPQPAACANSGFDQISYRVQKIEEPQPIRGC